MIELFLLAVIAVLVIALILLYRKSQYLGEMLSELKFRKSSQSVKYGQLTEQWIPFSDKFPYNPQNFQFLGKPIDGIVFDDNGIILCEFKTATSQLSEKQRRIKKQVKEGKVDWLEFRID